MTPRAIRIDHAAQDARMGDYPLAWLKPCVISFTARLQFRRKESICTSVIENIRRYTRGTLGALTRIFHRSAQHRSKRNSRALTVEIVGDVGLFVVRANYQSNLHSCHYTEASD